MGDRSADALLLAHRLADLLDLPARVSALEARLSALIEAVEKLRRSTPTTYTTMPEAARALGVSLSTLRRRIRSGEISVVRVGRAVRIDLAGLKPVDATEVVRLAEASRRSP